jgi:hypothetical protein
VINILKPLIKQFMPFAQERMGFDHPPRLFLRQDTDNADNPLGKTAYYDPQAKSVTLYITGRHPKDVMRSLSHELVHHKQNCNGRFDNETEMGEGYAQNNPQLRGMESEAYQMGNMCFRDWEDSIKGTIYNEHLLKGVNNTMSTKEWKNREITTLLSEAWGFGFDIDRLDEKTGDDETPEKAKKSIKGKGTSKVEEDDLEENVDLEEATSASLNWGGNEGDYKRKKEGGTRKKTGDVGGGKYGKGGHYKDYEKDESQLSEDSGEEEAWHDWKNEHADDDHIKEIEHHLRALRHDKDHEEHDAESDDDKYEDEDDSDLDEGGSGRSDPTRLQGRDSARDLPDRKRPMEEQAIRRMVRRTIRKIYQENKK